MCKQRQRLRNLRQTLGSEASGSDSERLMHHSSVKEIAEVNTANHSTWRLWRIVGQHCQYLVATRRLRVTCGSETVTGPVLGDEVS